MDRAKELVYRLNDISMDRIRLIANLKNSIEDLYSCSAYKPERYLPMGVNVAIDHRNDMLSKLEDLTKIEDCIFEELLQLSKEKEES